MTMFGYKEFAERAAERIVKIAEQAGYKASIDSRGNPYDNTVSVNIIEVGGAFEGDYLLALTYHPGLPSTYDGRPELRTLAKAINDYTEQYGHPYRADLLPGGTGRVLMIVRPT